MQELKPAIPLQAEGNRLRRDMILVSAPAVGKVHAIPGTVLLLPSLQQ